MNLNVYPADDHRDIVTYDLSPANADFAFRQWCTILQHPWVKASRVTLTDPLAGNRIVRDTDLEVFGLGRAGTP